MITEKNSYSPNVPLMSDVVGVSNVYPSYYGPSTEEIQTVVNKIREEVETKNVIKGIEDIKNGKFFFQRKF